MRTSLTEIQRIENFLFKKGDPEDRLLLEAQLQLNNELADQASWQKETYAVVREYGRQKLRSEIIAVQEKLFTDPEHRGFRQKILSLFKR